MHRRALLATVLVLLLAVTAPVQALSRNFDRPLLSDLTFSASTDEPPYTDSTFSLVAFDQTTGELGVIVQTFRPAVGNRCPWVEAGVGAVSTQAWTNQIGRAHV